MAKYATGCRKCGGKLIKDGDEIKCLNCGEAAGDNMIRARFYDQHRPEIELDIGTMKNAELLKKWRLAPATLRGLVRRWTAAGSRLVTGTSHHAGFILLPRLPEWSDKWPEAVQITWLKNWLYLVTQTKVKGVSHEQAN